MKSKNAPLTRKEQAFAAENSCLVFDFLALRGLETNDWYDVVIFRYLLSVQRWFAYPDLHRMSFRTLAFAAMRSAVSDEKRKQERRIRTISLDDIVPGTEDVTYHETITYENLNYKGVYDMNISYDVLLPQNRSRFNGGKKSDEVIAIESFITMRDKTNMRFEYKSEEEAKRKLSTVSSYMKKANLRNSLEAFRVKECIFIARKEDKK